jgi:hypothetical protein
MAEAAIDGLKTCTSRNKAYGNAGDTFKIKDKTFVLIAVVNWSLRSVAEMLYIAEGFDSPDSFKLKWVKLHPRKGWIDEQKVWVHFFRPEGD